ncbi:MAG: Efflux transporter, family, subunit [Pedosphaera sp.]|nr:Efflux transporter, family, subunit [Pedosphaera sp.]
MAKNEGFGLVGWLVVIVLVAAVGGGGYWFWQSQAEKAPDYKTVPVTRGDLVQMVTATGQLNPKTNVDVGSQVSGIIKRIYVDFNSPVTNRQVIAEIDPSTYQAIVAEARADLANAKAALELAQATEERTSVLYQSKIVAQADEDTAVAGFHQAQAVVLQKEATLQQAEVNLAYTTIYAPVDGVVISRNVDVGQTVAASLSSPTLFMIANDLTKMQIDALVSEADIGGVQTNQTVNFTVDAFPARTFQGVVLQIRNAAQTNQNVITYDTVIGVDNSELRLRPGMTANVSIITAQRNDVLKIPNGALRFHPPEPADAKKSASLAGASNGAPYQGQGGGGMRGGGQGGAGGNGGRAKGEKASHAVYMLTKGPDGKEDVLKPVQIKTGINDGVFTQLVEGLNEGDEVVIGQTIATGSAQAGGNSNPFSGGGRRF